jgi:hypothetical protein
MFTRIEKCTPGAKILGESGSAEDSVGWKKCDEAASQNEMEIRHVRERIVIRERSYESAFQFAAVLLRTAFTGGHRGRFPFQNWRPFSLRKRLGSLDFHGMQI